MILAKTVEKGGKWGEGAILEIRSLRFFPPRPPKEFIFSSVVL